MSDTSDRSLRRPVHFGVARGIRAGRGTAAARVCVGLHPIKFRATLDRTTGAITCDNAGMSFDGDIRAEWHPDGSGDLDGGEEFAKLAGGTGQNSPGAAEFSGGGPTLSRSPGQLTRTSSPMATGAIAGSKPGPDAPRGSPNGEASAFPAASGLVDALAPTQPDDTRNRGVAVKPPNARTIPDPNAPTG